MWNPERELVKKAAVIASDKHPNGYNKQQLIDASDEVYGGFSTNPGKKIKTMEDVNNMGNHMSEIDGHYPRGMSGCYIVGINGGCGLDCPVYLNGDCEEPQEFGLEPGDEGYELHKELYL
ncbi:MAG: hypothetical protein ACR2MX_01705 [Cyclobacteriaceae bacterium]